MYDLRKSEQVYTLTGHSDTPTSLSLSPNGSYLLSPSFSSHTIIHDIRPFSPSPSRIHRVLQGSPAGFENTLLRAAWSKDDGGGRVAVGGADRMVCIWDVESGRVLYKVSGCRFVFVSCGDLLSRVSYLGIKEQSRLLISTQRNLSVGLSSCQTQTHLTLSLQFLLVVKTVRCFWASWSLAS